MSGLHGWIDWGVLCFKNWPRRDSVNLTRGLTVVWELGLLGLRTRKKEEGWQEMTWCLFTVTWAVISLVVE